MRLTCPCCGARDLREFTYMGAALPRPEGGEWSADWHSYLHLRDNPAGANREHWMHGPCGSMMVVERNTATHAVAATRPPGEGGA